MGVRSKITSTIIKSGFKHRFTMARLTRVPALGRAIEYALFDQDEMIYLPKDSVVKRKESIIEVNVPFEPTNIVLPSQVIEHFLRRSRYIFIMNRCPCRDSNHCEHYPQDIGCVFLGAGVRKIDPSLGRMTSAEDAILHVRKAREAGLVHLIGRNKIDSVWLNSGAKEDLLSICNCCECCCLWKMMPQLSSPIASSVTRMPGVTVTVTDTCTTCRRCVQDQVCFVQAITIIEGRAVIDQKRCKGCGRCVEHCPSRAIALDIAEPDYLDRSIELIEPLVDLTKE
jgi:Fe-S-cluster-containing hydrogenase component 2